MGIGECIVAVFAIRCLYLVINKTLDIINSKNKQSKEEVKKDFALITNDIDVKDFE